MEKDSSCPRYIILSGTVEKMLHYIKGRIIFKNPEI